jgi:SAM-dependent methyltransferase
MQVPWKLKSALYGILDFLKAEPLLYFCQKNVTRRARRPISEINPIWLKHQEVIRSLPTADVIIFEFGAGKDLAQNMFLSSVSVSQTVVDLNSMIDFGLVDAARKSLILLGREITSHPIANTVDLHRFFNIDYKAPFDASITDFESGSVDVCISTNTLEHIPPISIRAIFSELRRVLKKGGLVSARIDYSDHYAHTDHSIGLLNFLRFSENDWSKHNHGTHFQNRLRHQDYMNIFLELGFKVLSADLDYRAKNIPDEIERLFVEQPQTWRATECHVVLRNV